MSYLFLILVINVSTKYKYKFVYWLEQGEKNVNKMRFFFQIFFLKILL